MLQSALWLAVACAFAGAFAGNRTAVVLLASLMLCMGLDEAGIQFNFLFWLLIDVAVIGAIIRPDMRFRDCAVLVLFLPAWSFYLADENTRYIGGSVVVILQLMLTFPIVRTWRYFMGAVSITRDDPGEKMVAHA